MEGRKVAEYLPYQYIIVYFLGGLAVFLYGMRIMSGGLKKISGERIRSLMSTLTDNRILGMLTGAFATTIVQSSSAIMVMLVGLVQSRIMTYVQAMGMILGAEIGTTVTAQLIAFRLHDFALIIFAAGFLLQVTAKKPAYKNGGEALAGFGLLFFGMQLMSEAMGPLRTYTPFLQLLETFSEPLFSVLAGTIFTALIQSSSAAMGIIILLGQQGSISLETGIALMLGANIGTCITAAIACIGTHRTAKRVSLAQIIFNVTGLFLCLSFIAELAEIVRHFSPSALPATSGDEAVALPRQIANAHTFYNVAMAFLFLPFTPLFARLVLRILPDKPEEKWLIPSVWHLKESALTTPPLALSYAWAEVGRMNKILCRMVEPAIRLFFNKDQNNDAIFPKLSAVDGIVMREKKINYLESAVTDYLFKIMRQELGDRESAEIFALLNIVKDQETLGDIVEVRIIKLLHTRSTMELEVSDEGEEEIRALHSHVCQCMEMLTDAIENMDKEKSRAILKKIDDFDQLKVQTEQMHLQRIQKNLRASESSHDIHMELIDILKQVLFYCKEITKNLISL